MELSANNKTINLVLKTRKIVDIARTLKGKNFEDVYFKAKNELDLDALSKIIYTLTEQVNGKKPFDSSQDVYDFLDDYKKETGKSYIDIYNEITEFINEECFFSRKMTPEELADKTDGLMSSINTENIVKNVVEKTVTQVAQEEFLGYKG